MRVEVGRVALRRAVLLHWVLVPGCYLLLRLGNVGSPLAFDVLVIGAFLGVLWSTLLAYTRWVSASIVSGMLIVLDVAFTTLALVLTGGLTSDFYWLYGLNLLLAAAISTSTGVLSVTLAMTLLSFGFSLWPGVGTMDSPSYGLARVGMLIAAGLLVWFYVRKRENPKSAAADTENHNLPWFQQISDHITPQTDAEAMCQFAVVLARSLTNADLGNVLLLDEQDETTGLLYTSMGNEAMRKGTLHLNAAGQGLCDRLIHEGQPLAEFGANLDVGAPNLLTYYPPVRSFAGVPFKSGQAAFGALFVANRHDGRAFTPDERIALAFLGTQLGMALDNRRLLREVRERFTSTIAALVMAIEAKHPYTRGHSEGVIRYAVATARELHLSEEQVETIRVAAVLHDIGKIGVPEGILDKPGALTERERALIMSHPYIGAKIVEALDPRGDILYLIYYHHENYDGSGYPKGLKGDQIPLGASILRVSDAFEAMTSHRPYQRTRTAVEALRELQAGAGRQFDPVAVRALSRALRRLAEEESRRGTPA